MICPSCQSARNLAPLPGDVDFAVGASVALQQVTVRQGAKFMLVDAEDERLTVGFHLYEADWGLRGTDGYAELPAETLARFDKGAQVMLRLGGTTRYPDNRKRAKQVAA